MAATQLILVNYFIVFFDIDNDMDDDAVCFPRRPQIDESAQSQPLSLTQSNNLICFPRSKPQRPGQLEADLAGPDIAGYLLENYCSFRYGYAASQGYPMYQCS